MSLVQSVVDGQIVDNKKTEQPVKNANDQYDKEMFLQLLVAEMQYQDPLEPTSNTEYVSELASFTQIEAVQAVQEQMGTIQANSLVGKYVILLDGDEYVSGKVDYVTTLDDGTYLSVNDKLYKIDTLDSVVEEEYYTAVMASQTLTDMIKALPNANQLTYQDEEDIVACRDMLDAMTAYQKGFMSSEVVKTLEALEQRLAEIKTAIGMTEE